MKCRPAAYRYNSKGGRAVTKQKPFGGVNALTLKCIAMALMLCDHLWATVVPGSHWLTAVGRLTYPIFAFQMVESYFMTTDRKRLFKRLAVFALISEIPFNLMVSGSLIMPLHQNVVFTFLLALALVHRMELARGKAPLWRYLLRCAACAVLGFAGGYLFMVDYYGAGVLTVLVFYWTRGKKYSHLLQLAWLWYINTQLLGGFGWPVELFGTEIFISQQALALLALPLIWLYNGKRGAHSRAIQRAYYAFYPVHMLVLALWAMLL